MRIIIIGSPGAGKSTFARKIKYIFRLPLFYLDKLFYKSDGTTVTQDAFDAKLLTILQKDNWIIDGNYLRTLPLRFEYCTDVFFLDYSLEQCLDGAMTRIGKPREDLPWIELALDPEFRKYILDFPKTQLPQIYEIIERYKDKRRITIFHSREESNEWLIQNHSSY